jgi:hypothetical protein
MAKRIDLATTVLVWKGKTFKPLAGPTETTVACVRQAATGLPIGEVALTTRAGTLSPEQLTSLAALHWRASLRRIAEQAATAALPIDTELRDQIRVWTELPGGHFTAEISTTDGRIIAQSSHSGSTEKLASNSAGEIAQHIKSISVYPYAGVHVALRPSVFYGNCKVPLQTYAEAKIVTSALAESRKPKVWVQVPGTSCFRYGLPRFTQLRVEFNASALYQGKAVSAREAQAALDECDLSAALLFQLCVAALREGASIAVGMDRLLAAMGWRPRNSAERRAMRRKVWLWMRMFEGLRVTGQRQRRYSEGQGKERKMRDLSIDEPLFRVCRPQDPRDLDADGVPNQINLVGGLWLSRFRHDDRVLAYLGDIRHLAALAARRPPEAWAQAMGISLLQLWREFAARSERPKPSRRELLALFPAAASAQSAEALLYGKKDPDRAVKYWTQAVEVLKQLGILDTVVAEPVELPRQGYGDRWLDTKLDVTPGPAVDESLSRIGRRRRRLQEDETAAAGTA